MSKGILGDYEMLNVLKYIWNKNNGICKIKYLFIGMSFQIFKRLSKKIISKTILMAKIFFYILIAMYRACMHIPIYQIEKKFYY